MYSYIIGKVIKNNLKSITLEHNLIGYVVNTPKPNIFEKGKIAKIYLYKHIVLTNKNTMIEEYYGFKTWEEKEFFLACLTISGIGPKTAINFLKNDIHVLKQLITTKDMMTLSQLPNINKKTAYLLVEFLSNIFIKDKLSDFDNISDVINVLKTLGYSQDDINFAINKLTEKKSIENSMETSDIVALAIKEISLKNETSIPKA